jgi:hypothetical protein
MPIMIGGKYTANSVAGRAVPSQISVAGAAIRCTAMPVPVTKKAKRRGASPKMDPGGRKLSGGGCRVRGTHRRGGSGC